MESIITLDESLITVMDASNDAMAIIDAESGQFVAINNTHSRLFGFPLKTLSKRGINQLYQFAQDEAPGNILQNLKQLEQAKTLRWPAITNLGGKVYVEVSCSSLLLGDEPYLLLTSKLDSEIESSTKFSGMASIEQTFQDSEAKWRSITDSSADHIMLVDTDGTILYINHTVPDLTIDQVLGRSCYDFVKPNQVASLKNSHEQVVRTGQPATLELAYEMDGGVIYLENRIGPVLRNGKVIALTVASRDVTGWHQALAALEKSQEHLSLGLAAGATGTWEWDLETNKVIWSDGVESLFRLEPGTFQGSYEAYLQLVHPDDIDKLEAAINQTLKHNKPYYTEHRCIYPNGSLHWVSAQGKVYRDNSGTPQRMIGTVTDITQRREAEETLRQSEILLSKSQEIAHIGSYSWDIQSGKVTWSDEMYRIFGLSPETFDGYPGSAIDKAVHPDDRDKVYRAQERLLKEKKPQPLEYRIVTEDGTIRYVDSNGYLYLDENGEVTSVIGTVQDITDKVIAQLELEKHRKHLEELVTERTQEIHEQALILEQIHDSVVSTDMNGFVTSWNRGAERMFGASAEEAIGQHISFVYPESEHQYLINNVIKPLKEKGDHEVEIIVQRKSGELFSALLSLSMRHDEHGNTIGMIGYSIDITARKLAEQDALQHKLALEHANKELESFSYSVSHDLRSPLRAMDGFSAALLDDYRDLLDDEGKEYLNRIRINAQRMATLIDDLLQLSRVSRQKLHKEAIDLRQLALDVIQKYKYENPNQQIQFTVEGHLIAKGDPGLMRIVLENLIGNACKYTSKLDVANIVLREQQNNGTTVYCIEDNGAGFDMKYADKLFGAFQRLHRPEEFPGNGIGLATVSRIIQRHGGKIWAEGKINEGAWFYFTLPDN
ncbi:MAG: PAS domain S-box protein [Gammaproteobacteria bacterium]|jgi:PAS domain S-box-containing protein